MKSVTIIFSRNRSMQLDATLHSYLRHCTDAERSELRILYSVTEEIHRRQYDELIAEYGKFPFIKFVQEKNFFADLLLLLSPYEQVLFLVDDNLFVRDFSIVEAIEHLEKNPSALGFSLRLGRNTGYCYMLNSAQRLPDFIPAGRNILRYDWTVSEHDFGYPLELSSSVYRTNDILPLIAQLPYRNPNTLEAYMSDNVRLFAQSRPDILCYESSVTFCAPLNKVQSVAAANRAGENTEYSPESLAEMFAEGYRIDVAAYDGFTPGSAHQEVDLVFAKNEAPVRNPSERTGEAQAENLPLVSVVIPCYKQAHFLPEAVGSVVAQSYPNWELIIVNDGSPDNTSEVARQLIAQYPGRKISLVEKTNGGLADARNAGIRQSRGAYILPLDSDDKIASAYLEEAVRVLEQNPGYGIVYVDEQNFGDKSHIHQKGVSHFLYLTQYNVHDYCSMYRREVWERTGGYSPAMYLGAEDWNFWLSAAKLGYRSWHLQKPLFLYRNTENSMVAATLASMDEVRAQVVLHHPEIYSPEVVAQAEETIRRTKPENREKLRNTLVRHPENPLLKKFAELAGLQAETVTGPLVSVIIPTYNRPEFLSGAIASVLEQNYRNFEIVVVNDAGESVRDLVESMNSSGRIVYIEHERNRDRAAARNTGIAAAKGELIAYLDDDDIFYPEHLATLAEAFRDPQLQFAYSNAYRASQEPDPDSPAGYRVSECELVYDRDFDREELLFGNYIPSCCVMHRKSLLDICGGFDESLRTHEDHDLWLRISRLFPMRHIRRITAEYRQRADMTNTTANSKKNFFLDVAKVYQKRSFLTDADPRARKIQESQLFYFYSEYRRSLGLPVDPDGMRRELPVYDIPSLSLIIPVHNQWAMTKQCIEQILFTQKDFSVEIIIVDNASSDATASELRKIAALHPQVRIITNLRNETYSHANNQGASIAKGKYFVFLNNDTRPFPGWLDALVETFEREPSIGVQGGKLLYPNNTVQHAGIVYGAMQTGRNAHYHVYLCMERDAACVNKAREFQMVTGALLAIRKDVFEKTGGFDERYVFGHEDLDLCLAVRKLGYRVWYNPSVESYHFESMTKKQEGLEKFELKLNDPDSIDAKNYHYFHNKWKGFLAVDDLNYYAEDGFIKAQAPQKAPAADKVQKTALSLSRTRSGIEGSRKKPRILFVMFGWNESGGGTTFPRAVAARIASMGYEIGSFYAALKERPDREKYYLEEGSEDDVRLFALYNRPARAVETENPDLEVYDEGIVRRFNEVLDSFAPDVVHFHNFHGLSLAIAGEAKKRGIATLYTPHNYHLIDPQLYLFSHEDLRLWKGTDFFANSELIEQYPEKRAAFGRRIEAAKAVLTRHLDYTLAVSNRMKELLTEFCGSGENIAVVHQVHETVDRIRAEAAPKTSFNKPLRFGFIGGVMPHKGVHILAAAAQLLPPGSAEFYVYGFVTPGCEDLIRAVDKRGVIKLRGSYAQSDLPKMNRVLDCIVVPSIWEDCAPLVVLEAMAMKLPVIASRIGGIPDFVQEGVNGFLYEHGRHEQLAAICADLILDREKLAALSRNCEIPYGFSDYVAHVLGLYTRLANGERPPAEELSMTLSGRPAVRIMAERAAPKVSVVIPCYKHAKFLPEVVESILAQTFADWEILIVNDGSPDNTSEVAAGIIRDNPGKRISLVEKENGGLVSARNAGIARAKGEYILPLDADDKLSPQMLEKLVAVLDANPDCGIAYCDLQEFGVSDRVFPSLDYDLELLKLMNYIPVCSLFRRKAWEAVGGYNPVMREGYEDWDFWIACGEKGYPGKRLPEALFLYRKLPESMYTDSVKHDKLLKAKIIRNHPGLYSGMQKQWAELVFAGDEYALSLEIGHHMPVFAGEVPAAAEPSARPLRILYVMYGWTESGGGTTFPRAAAKKLAEKGFDMGAFYAAPRLRDDSRPYLLRRESDGGVKLFALHNRPAEFCDFANPEAEIFDPEIVRTFNEVLDEFAPDVVHVHNLHGLSFALPAEAKKRGIPVFFTPHNHFFIDPRLFMFKENGESWASADFFAESELPLQYPAQIEGYKKRIETGKKVLSEDFDMIFAVSNRLKELLGGYSGRYDHISVIHQVSGGVDRILAMNKGRKAPHKPLRFGFLGNAMGIKGLHMLAIAAQSIAPEQAEFRVYGSVLPSYMTIMDQLDPGKRLRYMGEYRFEELSDIADELDCMIVPSVCEDCAPLVILEAYAMKLPVIGARIGGIPDFIIEGVNGRLYRHDRPAELAAIIAEFCRDPQSLERMSEACLIPYGFERYIAHIVGIYERFAAGERVSSKEAQLLFKESYQEILSGGKENIPQQKLPQIQEEAMSSTHNKSPRLNIVWEGSQFVYHSLALINREHCANIANAGVAELSVIPYEQDQFAPNGNSKYETIMEHDVRVKPEPDAEAKRLPYVWIRHQWPPKFERPGGAKWIMMQPWEFSTMPKEFAEGFKQVDEIWTPSNYSRRAFLNSGIPFNKVQVMPNGIDPELFTPYGNAAHLPTNKRLKFLFIGGTIYRKGIDILLDAYTKAFTAKDDVCLVIKDMGGDSFYQGQTAKDRIFEIKRNPDMPEIIYSDGNMTEEQIADLYRACDVFVSPYRGEGFSLPTLEAMACGLPVIVTEGGATDDFADEETGWLIPAGKKSIGRTIANRELTDEAYLLEPDGEVLRNTMRYIADNPRDIIPVGLAASLRARTDWTWKRATKKILSRLDALYETTMSREAGDTLEDREDGVILVARAEERYKLGDVDSAIELYTEALRFGSLTTRYTLLALTRLAYISLQDGDHILALDFLEKAKSFDSSHPDIAFVEALCLARQERWEDEMNVLTPLFESWKSLRFETALGITLDMILCELGNAFLMSGAPEDGLELFSQALKLNPENADACFGAALCMRETGNEEGARTMLEWALRLRPDFVEAEQELMAM